MRLFPNLIIWNIRENIIMSRIVKIKNTLLTGLTVDGISIAAGTYYTLTGANVAGWVDDSAVFGYIGDGSLLVNKGADVTDDIIDPIEGWKWLIGDTLPISGLGKKLAVHASSAPLPSDGAETFSVWTGAGDDMNAATPELSIGNGDLLNFAMAYDAGGAHNVIKDVYFDPQHGRVWIHEAYLKFENGGIPDYLSAAIMGEASPVQTSTSLDLVISADNWITYAPGGAGTGTHGFGGNPILIPRPYSKDGG